MYKVVINNCFGGFSLSQEALLSLYSKYGESMVYYGMNKYYLKESVTRHDKRLIKVIEEMGTSNASGEYAKLCIEEITSPMYNIDDYDGMETLETPDSYKWVVINEGSI